MASVLVYIGACTMGGGGGRGSVVLPHAPGNFSDQSHPL